MGCLPEENFLCLPLASINCQLLLFQGQNYTSFFLIMLGYCLAFSCAGLSNAITATVNSYNSPFMCFMLSFAVYFFNLGHLQSFYLLFQNDLWEEREYGIIILLGAEHSRVSSSLHVDQIWILTSSYKIVSWWELRSTLIMYESKKEHKVQFNTMSI